MGRGCGVKGCETDSHQLWPVYTRVEQSWSLHAEGRLSNFKKIPSLFARGQYCGFVVLVKYNDRPDPQYMSVNPSHKSLPYEAIKSFLNCSLVHAFTMSIFCIMPYLI